MVELNNKQNNTDMYSFGYTTLVNKDNEAWIGSIGKEILEIEDSFEKLIINYEDNKDILIKLKPPFYKYIINYLLWKYKEKLGIEDEDIRARATEIFSYPGKLGKNDLVEQISTLVYEDFVANGLSDKDHDNFARLDFIKYKDGKPVKADSFISSGIKKEILLSKNLQRKRMLILSFGINMDLETTNIFLRKVIGEEGLNFWNVDEFIFYLVKKYYDGRVEKCIEFQEKYKALPADQLISQDTVDNDNTAELMDIFSEFLEKTKDGDNLNIDKVLAAYKYIKESEADIRRSAVKRFNKAYHTLEDALSYDILGSKKIKKKSKNESSSSDTDEADDYTKIKGMEITYKEKFLVRVYPKLGKKVKIKKKEKIYASVLKKERSSQEIGLSLADKLSQYKLEPSHGETKEKHENEFTLATTKAYKFESEKYLQIDIKVRSKKKFTRKAKTNFIYHKQADDKGEEIVGATYYGLDNENIEAFRTNNYEAYINCQIKASDRPIEAGDIIYYGDQEFIILEDLPRVNYISIEVESENKTTTLDKLAYTSDKNYSFRSDNENIDKIEFESFSIDTVYKEDFLTYLYNEKALTAFNRKYYEKLNLSTDKFNQFYLMLYRQKISRTLISNIKKYKKIDNVSRSNLINILFLERIVTAKEEAINYVGKDRIRSTKEIKANYLNFMNNELKKVGMYEYNLSNSYEDLLARIACTEEPLETYRQVWGLYKVIYDIKKEERKKKKEERKKKQEEEEKKKEKANEQ